MNSSTPQAHLLVILPDQEFRARLEAKVFSVGSDPTCSLTLSGESVAARHCMIQPAEEGGGWEVFDLFSEAGTAVNGQRTAAAPLRVGDQITVGSARIVYLEGPVPGASPPPSKPKPSEPVLALVEDPPNTWESWQSDPGFELKEERAAASPAPGPTQDRARSPREVPATEPEPRAPGALAKLSSGLANWKIERAEQRAVRDELKVRERRAAEAQAAQQARVALSSEAGRSFEEIVSQAHRHSPGTFQDVLVTQLKSTPYVLISLAFHVCLAILLSFLMARTNQRKELAPVSTSFERQMLDDMDELLSDRPAEIDPTTPEPDDVPEASEIVDDIADSDVAEEFEPDTKGEADGDDQKIFDVGLSGGGLGLSGAGGPLSSKVGGRGFRRYVNNLRRSGLDIVLVIDSTASMGSVLDDSRAQIDRMIATIGSLVPSFRLGVVTFRDRGDAYITRSLPLSTHAWKAADFLDGIFADGGGDTPEAVAEGLRVATQDMEWGRGAKRVVILVGDAPPHRAQMDSIKKLAKSFTKKNGAIHGMVTAANSFGTLKSDPATVRDFRSIAKWGKGVSVLLEDSGAVIRRVIEIALGHQHKRDIGLALEQSEEGWRSTRISRLVSSENYASILKRLRKKRPDTILFRELFRANRAALLPVYLEAIEDEKIPMSTRWACTVLAKRLMVASRHPLAQSAAMGLDPEGGPAEVRTRIAKARRAGAAAGMPVKLH